MSGGRQDQYAATFGGVNFMEFHAEDRVIVNPLRVKNWILSELETSLVLFNSGTSRSSAAIIEQQTANLRGDAGRTLEAFHTLKQGAYAMKEAMLKGDFERFGAILHSAWTAKKQLADCVSNDHIDKVMDAALAAGARAGKISGAGGGGFITFLVPAERRPEVVRALSKFNGQVLTCHFTRHGTEGWKLY